MNSENKKPWLNNDGSQKSDQELKEICKDWGPTVWEEYLATLEIAQKEAVIHVRAVVPTEAMSDLHYLGQDVQESLQDLSFVSLHQLVLLSSQLL